MQDLRTQDAMDIRRLDDLHVGEIVDIINALPLGEAADLLFALPYERQIEVLDQPELIADAELIETRSLPDGAGLLNAMSADQAANVFRRLEEPSRSTLLALLDEETVQAVMALLAYPADSAGGLMTTEFVAVPATWTIAQTLDHIRQVERTRETVYAIHVLEPKLRTLVRVVTLRRLILGEPGDSILTAAPDRAPLTVTPQTDREEVARLISRNDLLALPVVDAVGHVLGIVTVDDVIDAIIRESSEDVQKFGGMAAVDAPYMQIGFLEMIRKRGGWLSVLFVSEMLTASAMQYFADELQRAVVLTLFIPLIMSSGGNSGSQATSLLIRALALREVSLKDWWKVALRELPTGAMLGALLGVVGAIRIAAWQGMGLFDYGVHWKLVALTVAAALVAIVTFGSVSGSMLPFVLKRLGFDPASASAPFVATLVDVSGLVIYFSVALVILHGTLL